MSTAAIERIDQLVDALKRLLESLSDARLKDQYCKRCGLLMTHVGAHFWLDGSDESWEIPLSYCANCNPEVGNHRSFVA